MFWIKFDSFKVGYKVAFRHMYYGRQLPRYGKKTSTRPFFGSTATTVVLDYFIVSSSGSSSSYSDLWIVDRKLADLLSIQVIANTLSCILQSIESFKNTGFDFWITTVGATCSTRVKAVIKQMKQ